MGDIKHFTAEKKDENTYGWPWNEVVKKYLQSGYLEEQKECQVTIREKEYKILKRDVVTAFYDADGNTLFDVTNDRLEKEYESMMDDTSNETESEKTEPETPMGKAIYDTEQEAFARAVDRENDEAITEPGNDETVPMGTASLAEIVTGLPAPTSEEIDQAEEENKKPLEQRAKEKLEKELETAKDKLFADPIIRYLIKRCEEDTGVASDVLQAHKTWEKCFAYILEKAKNQSGKMRQENAYCAAVRYDVVYEWAEDYFHLDDKAMEEKRKKEEEERKKKLKEAAEKGKKQAKTNKPAAPKKESSEKKEKEANSSHKKKEPDGQMSLFDLL